MIGHARLLELVTYDPDTGSFVWNVPRGNQITVGSRSGYMRKDGYLMLVLDGKYYLGHRTAWFYVTGCWPVADIDHRDGDPSNNRFSNLREANRSQNTANGKLLPQNTSGVKGVSYMRSTGKWEAYITKDYRKIGLGVYVAKEDAARARAQAEREIFGEFARAS